MQDFTVFKGEVLSYPSCVVLLGEVEDYALVECGRLEELRPQDDVGGAQLRDVARRHLNEFLLVILNLHTLHDP